MNGAIQLTSTIPSVRNSFSRSPLRRGFLLIPLALVLAWFALSPAPNAFGVNPPPDGGYPGYNTAEGYGALSSLTSGIENTATGFYALLSNTTGSANTANGSYALVYNNADNNTATGRGALFSNTTGNYNTASGVNALFYNVVGHDNTGEGFQALLNAKGSNNIGIGSNAGANLSNGSNNIDIGNLGVAGESNKIRIGKQGTQKNTYIAGIFGATVAIGVPVRIDSTGHLGTLTS